MIAGWIIGCGIEPGQPSATDDPGAVIAFTDVTEEAGLGGFRHVTGARGDRWFPETMGAGAGFIDYDGDGWLDVLLVGGGRWAGEDQPAPALFLYRNDGEGSFTDQTEAAGLDGVSAYGFGLAVADYDNDADQDFYLTTLHENLLFRNDNGIFTETGAAAGVAGEAAWSTSALFFDADADGWLDLYAGNYVVWSPENDLVCTIGRQVSSYCTPEQYEGLTGRFYRNDGYGIFTDQTEAAGFAPAPGKALGVAEADFNRDGRPDLVVVNDTQRDLLFENRGDGTFREIGLISGMALDENGRARAGMGVDAGVVDGSGEPSIFVGNFAKEMVGVYRYTGLDGFNDRAAVSRIGQHTLQTLTFGLFLFDVDLDGDLDLFAANGHISEEIEQVEDGIAFQQPAQLFLNRGDGIFDVARDEGPLALPLVARGAAYADYDRDGDLDILITENGGPVHLWRNDLAEAAFLRVHLEGRQSNRDAFGSRIVAVVGGRRMERRIRSGSSYLSQSEKAATFGLGAATRVDSLLIYWPAGRVDHFTGLEANQTIRIVEGAGRVEPVRLAGREGG